MNNLLISLIILSITLLTNCTTSFFRPTENGPLTVSIEDTLKDVIYSDLSPKKQLETIERCRLRNGHDSIMYCFGRVMIEGKKHNLSTETIKLLENEQLSFMATQDDLDFFNGGFICFRYLQKEMKDNIPSLVEMVISNESFFGERLSPVDDSSGIIIENTYRFDSDSTEHKKN